MKKIGYLKATILSSAFIFCGNPGGVAQSNPGKGNIVSEVENFFSHQPFENAYLQFDKPYYAAGDTIYFKAYVTEGEQHKPSQLSGILHVDLIDPKNKIDQSIKLRIDSGAAWGDFSLPESLPSGNYSIRAYTQLMRNYGQSDFFYKMISVGSIDNDEKNKKPEKDFLQDIHQKPDLQFFPEGGNLVTGISSKVAFKVIDANGSGIQVNGIILDNNNNEVCQFAATHLGMGYFFLNPDAGTTYKAAVTFANGMQDTVELPKSDSSGIRLSLNNNSNTAVSFKLSASDAYIIANRHKNFLLFIYSAGKAITYNFTLDAQTINLEMQKHLLHGGINMVTLFSPEYEPLSERLFFIQNNDQLHLHINADKTGYTSREKVNLKLNAKDPADSPIAGHFSVSVVDENKVPGEENNERNILTDLLLTSDLKGYVEQPGYYFSDTSDIAKRNLDVLMMTQGYRRFQWKQVMDMNYTPLVFQPEKALDINGKITNLSGKPLANATVNLIASQSRIVLNTQSDSNGLFRFSNLVFTDTTHFVLNGVNSKGRNSTKFTYFDNENEPLIIPVKNISLSLLRDTSLAVYLKYASQVYNESNHLKGKMLKPVILKGKMPVETHYRTESLAGAGNADQVMHADEIERIGGQLSTSLNGRLHGIGFINGVPYLNPPLGTGPMIVVIDGVQVNRQTSNGQISGFDVNAISSSQVETIEVLKNTSASTYGMGSGNGALIITTKQGVEDPKDITSVGVLPIAPMGFYKARAFYSPKYDHTNVNSKQPDLRSTIYWKPEIKTDQDGNASFDYYNADGKGIYKVTIEGIDDNGNVGRVVYRYKVE